MSVFALLILCFALFRVVLLLSARVGGGAGVNYLLLVSCELDVVLCCAVCLRGAIFMFVAVLAFQMKFPMRKFPDDGDERGGC